MRRAIPKLTLAVSTASVLLFAATPPSTLAGAAVPTPTPPAAKSKDVCGVTKSKWAHIQCEQFNSSAPGDEYFGRMKMSYLGIDNTYKDGAISAGGYTTDPKLISKLDFATDALRKWAAKYPNDPQLPRSYFLGVQVLRKVYTQSEQQTTWEFVELLVTKYGGTYFGKVMKASLANGYTEHWFALAQICPTPLPLGVMPETTPAATPSPTPAPGHPAIDVITPPCVQPSSTPEVEPTEAPTQPPTQAPSVKPTASGTRPLPRASANVPGPSPAPPSVRSTS
ncbi:MAG: hypothetical protein JOZ77_11225 [Candidatus Eremiobacteraeota bacterium]|nr:hypothetical protein [Candidatus Eremiobacteraeota bacterium]